MVDLEDRLQTHIDDLHREREKMGDDVYRRFGRRGAIQEQLTSAIHNAVNTICENNLGVIITIVATHNCVSCRGVKHKGAAMVTTKASGVFRHNGNDARQEFFNSLKINNGGHQI